VGVQVLRDRLAATHAAFNACRYHELAVTLPDVIATAHISLQESAGQQHEQIAALLADAFSLASELCIKFRDDALAWVTAERARAATEVSGDVASIAEAARTPAIRHPTSCWPPTAPCSAPPRTPRRSTATGLARWS
jgi:hypothetical protein